MQPIKMPISPKLPGKKSPQRWHESKNGSVLRAILSQRAVLRRSFAFRFWAVAQTVFGVIWYSEHNQTEMPGKLRISPLRARLVSGASLSYSLPLSFRLPSWTMRLLRFPSPFHMPLPQTPSPLLSLFIPQAKCISSNALRRWTMRRRRRLAFEMAQWWPKWVSCTPRGSSSFWTAVRLAGWRTAASATP